MNNTKLEPMMLPELDVRRLRRTADAAVANPLVDRGMIRMLNHELNAAVTVPPDQVPQDLVTMRTTCIVKDLEDGSERELTLCYPDEAAPLEGKISVLTPTGIMLFGAREGETVVVSAPAGNRRLLVKKILYQPEAAGHTTM